MDLRQLEILQAIAETGSFSGAADRLGLTQPAISHQLKRLEEELGETLVLRHKPRVTFLPAGTRVLTVAERVAKEIRELRHQFEATSDAEPSGMLRVTASSLGLVYLYGDLIEQFLSDHPNVELVVTSTENSLDGARNVLKGKADVAFAAFPMELPNLETVTLGEAEHVLIASPRHALGGRRSISLKDLRRHPFIRYQAGAGSRMASDRAFVNHGGYPPVALESNDTELIKRIVMMGLGMAMVPSFTVDRDIADGRLKVIRLANPGQALYQEFGMAYRPDVKIRALNPFLRFCRERPIGSLLHFGRGRRAARKARPNAK